MILKLSELRVVAFTNSQKSVKRLLWLCGYWVPKTYCSQRNQVAITLFSLPRMLQVYPACLHFHTSCPSTRQLLFWNAFWKFSERTLFKILRHLRSFLVASLASSEYWEVRSIICWGQQCSSRRTSRCIIEKHDRSNGWRYYWRQRYRSLGLLASQCTGKMRECWLKHETGSFWHCDEKSFLEQDVPQQRKDRNLSRKCTTSLIRRQNHNGEVVDRSWLCFFLDKLVVNVSLVGWCARIRLNVRIFFSEKETSTESKLLSAWGVMSIHWNI